MRDPARIERILTELRTVWLASPDLRLGQLLINVLPAEQVRPAAHVDPLDEATMRRHAAVERAVWNLEDDEWERALPAYRLRYAGGEAP